MAPLSSRSEKSAGLVSEVDRILILWTEYCDHEPGHQWKQRGFPSIRSPGLCNHFYSVVKLITFHFMPCTVETNNNNIIIIFIFSSLCDGYLSFLFLQLSLYIPNHFRLIYLSLYLSVLVQGFLEMKNFTIFLQVSQIEEAFLSLL